MPDQRRVQKDLVKEMKGRKGSRTGSFISEMDRFTLWRELSNELIVWLDNLY